MEIKEYPYSNDKSVRRVVVTGGYGFIGSNLILYLLAHRPNWEIINVDSLTYAANLSNLSEIEKNDRHHFVQVDIRNRAELQQVFEKYKPDGIFHLAAESHVDNSINDPQRFIESNIVGTFHLLEVCRQLWGDNSYHRFLHVSTDEVYGSLGAAGFFTEQSRYAPNSPYSASKAGSDHLVRAWHRTYGMNAIITHSANNFGPRQHREKLIPTVIHAALSHRPIPIYGDGSNVREWLYVEDHCSALLRVFEQGVGGESYAIGARNEWKNIDLVNMICTILDENIGEGSNGSYSSLITFVPDRLGHDIRYAIDPSKIEKDLKWQPTGQFQDKLAKTIMWFVHNMNRD